MTTEFDMTLEEAKSIMWGSYGKGIVEAFRPGDFISEPTWRKLGDLETDHLKAILRTQRQIEDKCKTAIEMILSSRIVPDRQGAVQAAQNADEGKN